MHPAVTNAVRQCHFPCLLPSKINPRSIMAKITIRGAEYAAGFHSACQDWTLFWDIRTVLLYMSMTVTILKCAALLGLHLIRSFAFLINAICGRCVVFTDCVKDECLHSL